MNIIDDNEIDKDLKKAQKEGLVRTVLPNNPPKNIGEWGNYLKMRFGFKPMPISTFQPIKSFGYLN